MVDVKGRELLWMVLGAGALDLDFVVDNVLALLLEDRLHIHRRAGRDGDQKHLDRRRSRPSISFRIHYLGVAARRRAYKEVIACVLDSSLICSGCHRLYVNIALILA